ncbi:MAG: hypothetical protein ACKOAX_01090, partial [Candidatus Kapaibacterium sp.]
HQETDDNTESSHSSHHTHHSENTKNTENPEIPAVQDGMETTSTTSVVRSAPYTIRSQASSVTYSVPEFESPKWPTDLASTPTTSALEVSIRSTRGLRQTLDSLVNRADAVNMGNIGIGLRYAVSPNLQLILEGGRENFATYVYDDASGPLQYRIQQNIVWAAAGVRGTLDVLPEALGAALFGQLLVGASDVGALVRPMAGVQWKPDRRITLFGGMEQMFLQTRAQGTAGTGSKLSVTYGLSLNF